MSPENQYQQELDILGSLFSLANELDHAIESPLMVTKEHERVHELVASVSGHLLAARDLEGYTGGGVFDAIEETRDRALLMLSEPTAIVPSTQQSLGLPAEDHLAQAA